MSDPAFFRMFNPRGIAVVGANTDITRMDQWGRTRFTWSVAWNCTAAFRNPATGHRQIGFRCASSD